MTPGRALLLCTLLLFASCRSPETGRDVHSRVTAAVVQAVGRDAYAPGVDFGPFPGMVAQEKAALGAAADDPAFATRLNGLLGRFRISHLKVRTPQEVQERRRHRRDLGLGFQAGLFDGQWVVQQVETDSPVWRAGLRRGDILAIPASQTPAQWLQAQGVPAPGASGEERPIALVWLHEGQSRSASVTRGLVVMDRGPELTWPRPGLAWIRVPSFREGRYDPARMEALLREAAGAEALVLDFRTNGGGLLAHVGHLVGQFLLAGSRMYCMVDRRMAEASGGLATPSTEVARVARRWQLARPATGKPYGGRVLALVSDLSASGGELAPAILKDQGRIQVLGTRSAGAVLGAKDMGLPGGWELQVPVMDVVTPGWRSLEGHPLVPDRVLGPLQTASDVAVLAAVEKELRMADPGMAVPLEADPGMAVPLEADPGMAVLRKADPRKADPREADPREADPREADPGKPLDPAA